MPLTQLTIQDFRNLASVQWRLAPGLNVLEGENAQGKTNLLEAVYYLANGRSFRTSDFSSLIRAGQAGSMLRGQWAEGDLETTIDMRLSADGRECFLQGKPLHRFAQIHKFLRVLVFTPDSSALFRGSPAIRRRYFDHAIGVAHPEYGPELSRYQRITRQRNQGLETDAPDSILDSFDLQWAEAARSLMSSRREYLRELLPPWRRRFAELSDMGVDFSASWKESAPAEASGLLAALRGKRAEERRRRRTLLGPHLDDIQASVSGHEAKEFASQGQQRLAVIALKLAEADLFQAQSGKSPIFLLDDLGSELDPLRQHLLIRTLAQLHAQTILTTAQAGIYADLQGKTSLVKAGVLFTKNEPYVTS